MQINFQCTKKLEVVISRGRKELARHVKKILKSAVTVTDEKTITKTMIPVYPCSTGHWFKHTVYEKDFEASKK